MAEIDPREVAFRQMLIELDKKISPEELQKLKFLAASYNIGDRHRKAIESSLDLWEKLKERGYLSAGKTDKLRKMLQSCGDNRTDLLDIVSEYERRFFNAAPASGQDLTKEINFLVDKLGRDWKFFMRALGLEESKLEMCMESHPRNVKEQIIQAFHMWKSEYPPDRDAEEKILQALTEVRRNDLHRQLQKGLT